METSIDAMLPRKNRGSFRIHHEYHAAYRRNRPAKNAAQRTIGGIDVSSPIVRIHDNHAAALGYDVVVHALAHRELRFTRIVESLQHRGCWSMTLDMTAKNDQRPSGGRASRSGSKKPCPQRIS